jgi:hypothetical protein
MMAFASRISTTRSSDHDASGASCVGSLVALTIFCSMCFWGTPSAQAQNADEAKTESSKDPEIPFAGIVQYAQGRAEKIEARSARSPLGFRSLLHEGDRVRVAASATLKIVTREGCIAVIHGPAQMTTPIGKRPWRIQGEAARWICPEKKSDSFTFNQSRFQIVGGEVLIDGTKVLPLSGRITVLTPEPLMLLPLQLYRNENKSWAAVSPQPHAYDLWLLNESRPPPKESRAMQRPERPPGSRLIFSPMLGGGLAT